MEGDIDRELFNLKKDEYEAKQKELEESALKYGTDNKEIYNMLEEIADVAGNAKKIFESPIISKKRVLLSLILSDSCVNGKRLMFSINKPFDKLLFSKGINIWCGLLYEYRTNSYDEMERLHEQINNLNLKIS